MIVELLSLIVFILAALCLSQFLMLLRLSHIEAAIREEDEDDYYEDGDTPPEFEEAMARLQPMELPILGTPDSDEEERLHVV